MRNAATNKIRKLMKKAESAGKNVRGLLNGREQGGIILTLVAVGFLVVSVVTVVAVTVKAGAEASRSSSAAWRVVDQQNEPVDPQVYDDAQNAAGPSQARQAGNIAEGAIAAQTIASPGSRMAPNAPINLDTAMSAGQLGTQLINDAASGTSTDQQPLTTGSDLDKNTKVNEVGDDGASGMGDGTGGNTGGGYSGGGCTDGCVW
ncbi:MAG: hypothetical protein P8105_02485 [Dehalococcoidia bacterium]|jgi:hypothetical protein